MTLSAVLVSAAPQRVAEVRESIGTLPWAEVHHEDDLGRLIAVVEGVSTEESVERLQAIQALPGVAAAEMVMHCYEEENAPVPRDSGAEAVAYLNDGEAPLRASHYRRLKAMNSD